MKGIPLFKIDWNDEDIESVASVIKRGSFWAEGPEIEDFERKISTYSGRKHALVLNSGTSAQHLLLEAMVEPSSEIIVPSFTFISTVNTVLQAGCKPVFADIERESYGIDVEDLKERIGPRTKAIVVVHVAGQIAKDIVAIREIAEDQNILLIEDVAEAMGAKLKGQMAGTFGDAAFLSFCQNKIITTGEGGAIITDNDDWLNRIRVMRSHGRSDPDGMFFRGDGRYTYTDPGYNMRMSTMAAALGISQLSRIDHLIKERRSRAKYYSDNFSNGYNIKYPEVLDDPYHVFQMYFIEFNDGTTRDRVKSCLNEQGIPSKVNFLPIHLESYYRKEFMMKKGYLPNTEDVSDRILTIPFHPGISEMEMDHVISNIYENL